MVSVATPSDETPGTATLSQVDDQERPARDLGGWVDRSVAVVAFAVAALAIWQVFRPLPQGSQYYLIVFLADRLSRRDAAAGVPGLPVRAGPA
jgi:hypothetical protein